MPRIIWTNGALADLGSIYLFLANKDKDAAAKAVDAIRKGAKLLKQFPQAGRPADDQEPEHRELLIPFGGSGYVLFYVAFDDVVRLLAVKHQKEGSSG